jgi:hypothetical protein
MSGRWSKRTGTRVKERSGSRKAAKSTGKQVDAERDSRRPKK